MNLIRQSLKLLLAATLPRRWFLIQGPRNGRSPNASVVHPSDQFDPQCADHLVRLQEIALTFDDGPHPEHTPRLLDRLQERGIEATFFVIGRLAERYPEIVRRMAAEGHDVGNHTYSHSEPKMIAADVFHREVRRTQQLLQNITGKPCNLFRPPKGELTLRKAWKLWHAKQTVVLWNVDPRDYRMSSEQDMRVWCNQYQPQGGDIVLMHDIYPFAESAVRSIADRPNHTAVSFIRLSQWLNPSNHISKELRCG